MFKKLFFIIALFFFCLTNAFAEMGSLENLNPDDTLLMELKDGIVVIETFPDVAPNHVIRIKQLTRAGFYNGLPFHRVIDGFMAQTGDPKGDGTGGSRLFNLNAEFSDKEHVRGTVSMARSSDPNSANSQFFIVTGDSFPHLDGKYTVWGRVISGMEYVDNIKKGDNIKNGMVEEPDKIIKMVVASDLAGKTTNDKSPKDSIGGVTEQLKQIQIIQDEDIKTSPQKPKKSLLDIMLQIN